jgi:hypothetical protein
MHVFEASRKFENFSNLDLPVSSLYLLAASTPDEVQEQVIARAENGETFTHAQIKDMIAQPAPALKQGRPRRRKNTNHWRTITRLSD